MQLEFPHAVGPFVTAPANLVQAFSAFFQQNPFFPKPALGSTESTMIGMDPHKAGMGSGEIVFSQLSPLHPITLDDETKKAANIPLRATSFAWTYPMVMEPGQQLPRGPSETSFVQFGGYMYFDADFNIVATNSIQPAPLGTLGLMFGRAQPLSPQVVDTLTRQGRFQEITLQPLSDTGATHFAWIRPGEFDGRVASPDGAFAYKFVDGLSRYFPVVGEPVFTPEHLKEELDESEEWVVIRIPAIPTIERLLVLDRSKTLEENLFSNSNCDQLSKVGLQQDALSAVEVCKDSNPNHCLSYDNWCNCQERSTVIDPWVFKVVQ
eukprot:TRINITY_DN36507_c0_g1_i1.p1 TRINITY_DN36507_c0_g1~~TRINITY_DN36507_c0_g1_i1.p1  ORF type:complete len:322 (-),score=44.89 TRINITY_DN36507_c0_g1_i1:216-1181(-)